MEDNFICLNQKDSGVQASDHSEVGLIVFLKVVLLSDKYFSSHWIDECKLKFYDRDLRET